MSVNTMSFEDAAALLNSLRAQATGAGAIAMVTEGDFVSVAQATLQTGFDPMVNAISQVVGRTIFSERPYNARFGGLQMDAQRWGYITRKLAISDKPFTTDQGYALVDGQSIDQYTVNKPNVLQLNFYGQNTFSKYYTTFKEQLESAFHSSAEFGQFISLVTQNALDMIESARENTRRMTIGNFIAGKIAGQNGVVHAITEYNADTQAGITAATVYDPANFGDFCKWLYARIAVLSSMMEERTNLFQIQVTGKEVTRHTPKAEQQLYVYAPFLAAMSARVLGDTFHKELLEYNYTEAVNFWQSAQTPDSINATPTYLKNDGTLVTPSAAVQQAGVIAVLMDRDAAGVTTMNESVDVTPFNASGRYWNTYHSFIERYYNDFTEKGVVVLLD
jgi:hypothetical protein